ncbi:hypothetical protein, partial [Acidiphilium sp.]|uniref:hypothetical protein n=1 Tax=Acidiphilium sp. TaxID=527 RepID=UPI003D0774D7
AFWILYSSRASSRPDSIATGIVYSGNNADSSNVLTFAGAYSSSDRLGFGESDFINNPGTLTGGFSWVQLLSTGIPSTTGMGSGEIANLSPTGTMKLTGGLIASTSVVWGDVTIPATINAGQGGFLGWNNKNYGAECDYVNYRPSNTGVGGHAWWDFQIGGSAVLLAQLLGNGNFILTGFLQLANAYVASSFTPTGTVAIKDSTGTTYYVGVSATA